MPSVRKNRKSEMAVRVIKCKSDLVRVRKREVGKLGWKCPALLDSLKEGSTGLSTGFNAISVVR